MAQEFANRVLAHIGLASTGRVPMEGLKDSSCHAALVLARFSAEPIHVRGGLFLRTVEQGTM
jgi:hypothetical protein